MLMQVAQGDKQSGQPGLVRDFDVLAKAPGGVARLRELILTLAVQGKLVAQDAGDEPANVLLQQINAERARLIAERRIKKNQPLPEVSDEEKSFDLPEGWEWARLGTLGQIVGGGTPKSDMPEYWAENGVAWLTPADLYNRREMFVSRGRRDISPEGLAASSSQLMPTGSVLFSSRAPIGYVAVAASPLATNQGFKSCVPYAQGMSEYLYWQLKYLAPEIDAGASGTTFKEISGKEFADVVVSLPPLAEQSRIVARVEELMCLCDALEAKGKLESAQHSQLLNTLLRTLTESASADELAANWQRVAAHFDLLLDRPEAVDALEQTILQLAVRGLLVPQDPQDEPASVLLQNIRAEKDRLIAQGKIRRDKPLPASAVMEQPFELQAGWVWSRLGELALRGPTNGLSPRPSELPTAVRCLSLSATTTGVFKPECFKHVEVSVDAARPHFLKSGDLLIQRGNSIDYVGIAAIYDGPDDAFIFPDLMMRLQLCKSIDVAYVHLAMVCAEGREYFMRNATGTQGTMPKVNQATVAMAPVALPPLAEQSRIVARVTELRRLCAELRQRLASAQATQARLAEALVVDSTAGVT